MRMNASIAVLAGLTTLMTSTPSSAEKWVYVTAEKTTDGEGEPPYTRKFYIDADSLLKSGTSIKIWHTYFTPDRRDSDGKPVLAERRRYFLYQYDCDANTRSILRYDRFEDMIPDFSVSWDSATQRTESIVAGSVGEKIFQAACALR
ncbi:MAG: hypothetical protein RLZZ561_821 [Pseudomonadota bacterium]